MAEYLSEKLKAAVFKRDRWLCRWCSRPVVFAPAMRLIDLEMSAADPHRSVAYFHGNWSRAHAPLLDELGATVDHVAARSTGGSNALDNLATACGKCNVRKGKAPPEDWDNRHKYAPVKGKYGEPKDWDGFSSLFMIFANRYYDQLTSVEKKWLRAFSFLPETQVAPSYQSQANSAEE